MEILGGKSEERRIQGVKPVNEWLLLKLKTVIGKSKHSVTINHKSKAKSWAINIVNFESKREGRRLRSVEATK